MSSILTARLEVVADGADQAVSTVLSAAVAFDCQLCKRIVRVNVWRRCSADSILLCCELNQAHVTQIQPVTLTNSDSANHLN